MDLFAFSEELFTFLVFNGVLVRGDGLQEFGLAALHDRAVVHFAGQAVGRNAGHTAWVLGTGASILSKHTN
jgi:hypothetical protein